MNSAPKPATDRGDSSSGDVRSFLKILRFGRPYWAPLIVATLILLVSSGLSVVSAKALGALVDRGLIPRDAGVATRLGWTILVVELSAVIATYAGRRMMASASNGALLLIRERLYGHLNRLPMSYFDREPLGRVVTRMTYDVEGLEDFFGTTVSRLMSAFLSIVAVTAGMLTTDLRLGLIAVVSMIPAALVTWYTRLPVRHWNREMSIRNSQINAKLNEFLNGLPVIRYFGAERWSADRFDAVVDHHLEASIQTNVLNSWIRPAVLILVQVPLVALLIVGGREVVAGTLALGTLVAFIRYCERFSRPISSIAQEIQVIQAAFTSAERVSRFLDHPTEDVELGADGAHAPPAIRGAVEFRNLTMAYTPGHNVLRDISFSIQPGETIGLAGRTGSGKTTTVALLSRLYEFQGGDILVDGISVRGYARGSLRQHIGFVSQDVTIFRGTLGENLLFGAVKSDDELARACEATGLAHLMARRGLTLDSTLLDHGANLSAGEKQLVALTRTLLRNPSLLVLDEATANVDEACEELLQRAVLTVMKGRSCLMIAHRLSTLEACDRILVFRDGQLVEQGPHADLVAKRGYYADLIRESAQSAEPQPRPTP